MAEEDKKTPRPLEIKPINIKPMTPPAPFPAPPAGDAEAPQKEEAPKGGAPMAAKSATQQLTPTVIQPKGAAPAPLQRPAPLAPTPTTSQRPPNAGAGTPPPAANVSAGGSATGRPLSAQPTNTTVRLKPVVPPSTSPASPANTAPIKPIRPPTIHPPTFKPSSAPVSESAVKAKTSRISLDAVFADATSVSKSATGPAPVGKITGNLTAAAEEGESSRRPTLRFSPSPKTGADSLGGIGDAPTVKKKKPLVLKKDKLETAATAATDDQPAESDNVSAFAAFQTAPAEKTNVFFPIVAALTCFVVIALILMYMSQASGLDRSLTAYSSIPGGPNIDWPGKIMTYR